MSAVGWIGAAAELLGSALDIFDGDRKREAETAAQAGGQRAGAGHGASLK